MAATAGMRSRRLSAAACRAEGVARAMERLAPTGRHGTSTAAIAADPGVSPPYLFRL